MGTWVVSSLYLWQQCPYEHCCAHTRSSSCFTFFWVPTWDWHCWATCGRPVLNLLRHCQSVCKQLHRLTFPPAVHEVQPPHILGNLSFLFLSFLLKARPSGWLWRGNSLGVWLASPWWLVMLSVLPWAYWPLVYLLWRNVYSNTFAHFLNWVIYLLLSRRCPLYSLGISLIRWWFAKTSSHSVGCIFALSMVPFGAQMSTKSIKSKLPFLFLFAACALTRLPSTWMTQASVRKSHQEAP